MNISKKNSKLKSNYFCNLPLQDVTIIESILEKSARYDIEKDIALYYSLQKMRKNGGTLSMKTYWECVRLRKALITSIMQKELQNLLIKKTKGGVLLLLIINFLLFQLMYFVFKM